MKPRLHLKPSSSASHVLGLPTRATIPVPWCSNDYLPCFKEAPREMNGIRDPHFYAFFFTYSSLIQYIQTAASHLSRPPSPPTRLPSLSQIHCSSVFLQKRAGLPMIATKHGLTRCNTNPHSKVGRSNLVGGKGSHERAKESETPPLPLLGVP